MITQTDSLDHKNFIYGFAIEGNCTLPRRLSIATEHFAGCSDSCPSGESYLSLYRFNNKFADHLNKTGSVRRYTGPTWASWIWFDIDRNGEPQLALDDARLLVRALIELGSNADDLLIFFSGQKGFHVGVSTALFSPLPAIDFPTTTKMFCKSIASQASIIVDLSIYHRLHSLRKPNSRHPQSNLFKRHLSYNELMKLSANDILKLANKPIKFDIPSPSNKSVKLAALWGKAVISCQQKAPINISKPSNASTIIEGERNATLTSLGGSMRRIGLGTNELAAALLQINKERCKPPLDEQEVQSIAKSMGQYQPNQLATTMATDHNDLSHAVNNDTAIAKTNYTTASTMMELWKQRLFSGEKPVSLTDDTVLAGIPVGPGLVTLLGGKPGLGKTALVMQIALDAIRANEQLTAVVISVEMTHEVLLDRQLSRLSGVPLTDITNRQVDNHMDRIETGINVLEAISERLIFVDEPFGVENIVKTLKGFDHAERPVLLVVDYLQRIRPHGKHNDTRAAINSIMGALRSIATSGISIVCVAALSRSQDDRGRSSYDAKYLSLSSFRESGEIEYGADSAYILNPGEDTPQAMTLKCVKNRHGEMRDIAIDFQPSVQSFTQLPTANINAEGGE